MAAERSRSLLTAALLIGGLALALLLFSDRIAPVVRPRFRDLLQPGQRVTDETIHSTKISLRRWIDPPGPLHQTDEVKRRGLRRRQLEVANARMRQRLQHRERFGPSPYRSEPSSPLVIAELLAARILGEETARLHRGGWLLDRGSDDGLSETDLVLHNDPPLLDVGSDFHLEPGFLVFTGRTVLGRVANVGRRTSTVQRITDGDFRGHAQLVRKTKTGYVFGATGVLKGTGMRRCRLTMIPADEPVAVGDRVYTPSDGGFPYPMYYGTVQSAELSEGSPHWTIHVEPVAADARPNVVQILRRRLNPARNRSEHINAN